MTCLESKFCPMYIVCWQINYSVNKNVFSFRDFSEILCLNCGWLFKSPDGKTHQIRKGKRMALKIVFLTSFPGLIGLAIFDTIELEVELKTKIKSEKIRFFLSIYAHDNDGPRSPCLCTTWAKKIQRVWSHIQTSPLTPQKS